MAHHSERFSNLGRESGGKLYAGTPPRARARTLMKLTTPRHYHIQTTSNANLTGDFTPNII